MNALPEWIIVGAETYGNRCDGEVLTVKSVGKSLIVLSDGSKWRTKDLYIVGTPPAEKRYGTGIYPRLESKTSVDLRKVRGLAWDVQTAASQFEPSGGGRANLVEAIERLAPHLGLTVTRMPEQEDQS